MTPGTQSPFFLLLLLTVLTATTAPKPATVVTGSGHASSTPGGEKETSATQRSSVPSSTEKNAFNSSLEDPSTDYYQELQRDISEMAVCQCRRKNYGQLDIFPARDTYHPMSEYPTYHTHGRYVPPSSTDRSPYEKVSAGNGGSSLSYTNPAVAATSANL
ncbi:mucin 1, cell surface associated [Homo sapiens]|uniref:Epididymis secretory sperm binding protein n=2 Tax=Homo sapiens TaxID=9606 RepID=A0A384NPK6_HUMAN|nr:mucin-1 isoform 7 precursor [Homo sapiens]AAP97015.1 mucin short variant S2 [Homo sapiens]ADO22188.1 epididymis secretory sperm binding protein [Homo sapiens]KAI2519480.1 mucin 1, cell surface associated [Homo sapiens]KAI4083012.1 mucin 1, cell surface associated [Homo sapiens]|eukprot:NP_001037857.1 mucin-1 isoform 7 precursor [Homo sapiens]